MSERSSGKYTKIHSDVLAFQTTPYPSLRKVVGYARLHTFLQQLIDEHGLKLANKFQTSIRILLARKERARVSPPPHCRGYFLEMLFFVVAARQGGNG